MLALSARASTRASTISWARLMSSKQSGAEVRWSGVDPTDSQADVAADRAAAEIPARPNAALQEETVEFLKAEDKLNSNPPADGKQAAADFAKLQKASPDIHGDADQQAEATKTK